MKTTNTKKNSLKKNEQSEKVQVSSLILKPDLANLSTKEKVKKVCDYLLRSKNCFVPAKSMAGKELHKQATEQFGDVSFEFNTFIQYLANISKEIDSVIKCPGRKQGYYVDVTQVDQAQGSEADESGPQDSADVATNKKTQIEKLLYPLLKTWLLANDYAAEDVSTLKGNGSWGNPDLLGLKVSRFGAHSLEIVTIEAKYSKKDWERLIFEAVSHRRFANRAYFAFAYPSGQKIEDPKLRYYSELYSVGILIIELEQQVYDEYVAGKRTKPFEQDDVEIYELYSAPFSVVRPQYQWDYCSNSLKMTCEQDIQEWFLTHQGRN